MDLNTLRERIDFISFRNSNDLNKANIFYIDFQKNTKGENVANGFTKTISLCSMSVKNDEEIIDLLKSMSVLKINELIKSERIFNFDEDLFDKIILRNIMNNILNKNVIKFPIFDNCERFIIVSKNLEDKEIFKRMYASKFKMNKSSDIEDEIIFGFVSTTDQPGVIGISDDENLKDFNNIRFAITDIGFFPEIPYFKIKINRNNL